MLELNIALLVTLFLLKLNDLWLPRVEQKKMSRSGRTRDLKRQFKEAPFNEDNLLEVEC